MHRRLLRTLVTATLALGLTGGAALAQGAGIQRINPHDFLGKLRAVIDTRQGRIETASLLNTMPLNPESQLVDGDLRTRCYFDFGDTDRFLEMAASGLSGVVVDPEYMRGSGHGNTQAIYQNVNTLTLTFSSYEAKYNGFIILPAFTPAPGSMAADTTQLHEAIHAVAFGAGRTDLDEDGRGKDAPEYISGSFFIEQHNLAKFERNALLETQAIILNLQREITAAGDASEDQVNGLIWRHVKQIQHVAEAYLRNVESLHATMLKSSDHSWAMVHELMGLWGGRADWDGLLRDTRAHVEVLRRMARSAAAGAVDPQGTPEGGAFARFFFKQRCIPE